MKLKKRYLSHTRHFVLKICETIRTSIRSNYSNTRILFGVPKNPNTEYRILFGIEKSRIPNTNTTIRSNYSNSIRIPNYSSHPGQSVTNTFFGPNTNTEYYSVFRNHRIPNIEYYSVLRKSEYRIPNNIRYQENPNTEYE